MSIETAITFFLAIFIFAITPGPGVFAILSHALTSNAKACFPLVFGIAISDIVYLVMATLGLASIAENWSGLFTIIRFVGAAYLIYLGWKMWTAKIDTDLAKGGKPSSTSWLSGFIQGFLISASNPKVILFYIAFLPTFMDLSALKQNAIILTSGLALLALMSALMLIAVGGASIKKKFQSKRNTRYLNRSAGGIMIGAGLFLATTRS